MGKLETGKQLTYFQITDIVKMVNKKSKERTSY